MKFVKVKDDYYLPITNEEIELLNKGKYFVFDELNEREQYVLRSLVHKGAVVMKKLNDKKIYVFNR